MGQFTRFGRNGQMLLPQIPRSFLAGGGRFPGNGLAGTCLLGGSAQRVRSAGGAQMKCKANSAAYVNGNTPLESDDCDAIL